MKENLDFKFLKKFIIIDSNLNSNEIKSLGFELIHEKEIYDLVITTNTEKYCNPKTPTEPRKAPEEVKTPKPKTVESKKSETENSKKEILATLEMESESPYEHKRKRETEDGLRTPKKQESEQSSFSVEFFEIPSFKVDTPNSKSFKKVSVFISLKSPVNQKESDIENLIVFSSSENSESKPSKELENSKTTK